MNKIIVTMKLELRGYEDEEVVGLSYSELGEMISQSDTVIQDLSIDSFKVEEE